MNLSQVPSEAWGCLIGGVILLVLGVGLTSYHHVGPTEIAIAERGGVVIGEKHSGIHWDFWTWYTYYDTKIQVHQSTQAAATNDLQDINVDISVGYKLQADKLENIYQRVGNQAAITAKVLDPVVAQTLKSVSTKYSGEELIQKRNEVSTEVKSLLTDKLSKEYNLDVTEVALTNMVFTNPDFNAAIDRKQIAEQQSLQAKFELDKAKIDAQKQRALQQSLTKEILEKMWLEKWDGRLPQYVGKDIPLYMPSK